MLLSQEVVKKGVDMHSIQPTLQADSILLDLLNGLALVHVGCFDAQIKCKLTPCFDHLGV